MLHLSTNTMWIILDLLAIDLIDDNVEYKEITTRKNFDDFQRNLSV